MLTILPILILMFGGVVVFLLRKLPRGEGFSWLSAIFFGLFLWGGILAYHWFPPPAFELATWKLINPEEADAIIFLWDDIGWVYGFSLLSVLLAVLLTAATRLKDRSNPTTWASNLMVTAMALPGVLSVTPLAAVLSWTAFDLIELMVGYHLSSRAINVRPAILTFSARAVGTFFLIAAMIIQQQSGIALTFDNATPTISLFLFLAVGIRVGVLPINIPLVQEKLIRRGIGTNLRLSAIAVSLSVAARLPGQVAPDGWIKVLLPLIILASIYASVMWFRANDEIAGRRYWSIALAAIGIASLLNGYPTTSVVWGVSAILAGSIIFLYTARSKVLLVFPALAILQISTLPFTPGSSGWSGILGNSGSVWNLLLVPALGLVMAGMLHHSLRKEDELKNMDSWVGFVYPVGFMFLVGAGWLIATFSELVQLSEGVLWASLVATVIFGLIIFVAFLFVPKLSIEINPSQLEFVVAVKKIGGLFGKVFDLGWFYRFLWFIYSRLQKVVAALTPIFEGEGGVIWAFVLLALLVTLLGGGISTK